MNASESFAIYCDESCHLLNDHLGVMVLGGVWCPVSKVREITSRIRDIKEKHEVPYYQELKWNKVSPAKLQMYLDLVDYFFDDDDLRFRGLLVPDKSMLRHSDFGQDHDTWYFKMYFTMLNNIVSNDNKYFIYLDIKDTRSSEKIQALHEVLATANYDFSRSVVRRIQPIRSEESQILQLADIFIGAVSATNRKSTTSPAKTALIERIRERTGGFSLQRSTLLAETKFNLFRWQAQAGGSR